MMVPLRLCATQFDDVCQFLNDFFHDASRAIVYTCIGGNYVKVALTCLEYSCKRSVNSIDCRIATQFFLSNRQICRSRLQENQLPPRPGPPTRFMEPNTKAQLIDFIRSGEFDRLMNEEQIDWVIFETLFVCGDTEVSKEWVTTAYDLLMDRISLSVFTTLLNSRHAIISSPVGRVEETKSHKIEQDWIQLS